MKRTGGRGVALIALLGMGMPLLAAQGSARCADIFDDARRLACYDAQFGKPVRPLATQAPVAKTAAPAKPRKELVTGRITRVIRIADDRFQVTLDTGQAWTQLERDPNAEVAVGDTIKIRPAMLGSWMLETPSGVRTRVRPAP